MLACRIGKRIKNIWGCKMDKLLPWFKYYWDEVFDPENISAILFLGVIFAIMWGIITLGETLIKGIYETLGSHDIEFKDLGGMDE
jgi:hypothetical protein